MYTIFTVHKLTNRICKHVNFDVFGLFPCSRRLLPITARVYFDMTARKKSLSLNTFEVIICRPPLLEQLTNGVPVDNSYMVTYQSAFRRCFVIRLLKSI